MAGSSAWPGACPIAAAGLSYLAAGWVGQHTSAHVGVTICAAVCLVLIAAIAATWPHQRVRTAVDHAYATTSSRAA